MGGWWEQKLLQVAVIPRGRHRPSHAGLLGALHVLSHHRMPDAATTTDGPVAQPERPLESQDFFDLAHGYPLCRHLRPFRYSWDVGYQPWLSSVDFSGHRLHRLGRGAFPPESLPAFTPESLTALQRNQCPPCVGTGGMIAAESVSALGRNTQRR